MDELQFHFTATEENSPARLDKFLAAQLPEYSRRRLQELINQGHATISGQTITDCSHKVKPLNTLDFTIPPAVPSHMEPKEAPLDIIYEDEHLLVINKPAGLTVHPGAGNQQDTLVNILLHYLGDQLSGIGGVERPGIVHRLDKDTTGLMVVAKTDHAHRHLSDQLKSRTLSRHYLAFCWGVPKPLQGSIDTFLGRHPKHRTKIAVLQHGGKEAITHYQVKKVFGNQSASLVECHLETGRTHQIRVHMQHLKHPIIGDPSYGLSKKTILQEELRFLTRQALHAWQIHFEHPASGEQIELEAPLPEDLVKLQQILRDLG